MRNRSVTLDRPQIVAILALVALVGLGAALVVMSYVSHAEARAELDERLARLAQLQQRQNETGAVPDAARRTAPPSAFLDAPTPGLAAAQLQAHVVEVASAQGASIESLGLDQAGGDDAKDAVRVQVTLDLPLAALQALLYALESSTPYVFVDALTLQAPRSNAEELQSEPKLRAMLSLRALWRRAAS